MTLREYSTMMSKYCTKEEIKLFNRFLRMESLTSKFESNLVLRESMSISSASELIENGFTWSKSPEKFTFWNNVNDKWAEVLQNEEKKV